MKFTANSTELQRALAKASGVLPAKSAMPILETMLFELINNTLGITATDMEVSLDLSVQVNGAEDGKIAIPAKRLLDTVRSLPDTSVTFSIDTTTNKIGIATENGHYSVTGENAKEFPQAPQFKATDEIKLDGALLRRIIHRTAFAVSMDELRPSMMGVLFQTKGTTLRAVATDGHRLVRYEHTLPAKQKLSRDIIIPAKALSLVGKLIETGEVVISVGDTHARFQFDGTRILTRLIDEPYPNYESVIPTDNDKVMTLKRNDAVASLRRVALYASAATHQVRLSLAKGKLTLSAQDVDFGGEAREAVACDYNSDNMEIGFNSGYIVDMLSHLDAEQVSFKFSTATRAGIITPVGQNNGEDLLMLVMPVRLSN